MIFIKENSIVNAWKKTVSELYHHSPETQGEKFRDDVVVLEIKNTKPSQYYDARFPLTKENIDVINNFFVTGENEEAVIHEWTKLYRHRLVRNDYDQIKEVIEYLKKKPQGLRAQMSVWNQEEDLWGGIGPCFQLAWFRVNENNKLDIHIHMRASDAYGKLLMNINEFIALQNYVAKEIGLEPGLYIQFIDSCHLNNKDKDTIDRLILQLK
jgi:thymidylate synthase